MVNYAVCSFTRFFYHWWRECKRDIVKKATLRKAPFSKKLRFSIIISRMKKLPKQDEFGILG
jgi:hypothetical protein